MRGLAKPVDIDPSRNRLRLAEWQRMFDEIMPGTEFRLRGPETPEMIARAKELVKSELHEYSVKELVNYQLSALWKNHL
jgi:hypothetical protein